MTEKTKKYLSDIVNSIELIKEFMEGIEEYEQYEEDMKTQSAVERQLSIIGEAVNRYRNLEEEKLELSNTKQIIGFRNRIIHAYDNIDRTIVWLILKRYLPVLEEEAREGLNK